MTSEGVVRRRNLLSVVFQIEKKKGFAVIKTLLIARVTVNI